MTVLERDCEVKQNVGFCWEEEAKSQEGGVEFGHPGSIRFRGVLRTGTGWRGHTSERSAKYQTVWPGWAMESRKVVYFLLFVFLFLLFCFPAADSKQCWNVSICVHQAERGECFSAGPPTGKRELFQSSGSERRKGLQRSTLAGKVRAWPGKIWLHWFWEIFPRAIFSPLLWISLVLCSVINSSLWGLWFLISYTLNCLLRVAIRSAPCTWNAPSESTHV